ncbi:hypothetical protein CesoFtcFv8_012091 [Champsocephalus esox]|uniref:Uncharacterized protein n=1 Tax=Champsocephalus esox TaxID=159716 RepID=A0AAN8BWQ2_9TELE|nr:hypothetical protein CesoFtcFv8_012091 [Champsocephalus esox]
MGREHLEHLTQSDHGDLKVTQVKSLLLTDRRTGRRRGQGGGEDREEERLRGQGGGEAARNEERRHGREAGEGEKREMGDGEGEEVRRWATERGEK